MEKKALKGEAIKQAETYLKQIDDKQHFVILKETFYKNQNLTGDEIALFVYLITRAPTYKPNHKGLKKALKMGDDRYFKASKGLQDKGYLIIDKNGKNGTTYTLSQTPTGNAEALGSIEETIFFNEPSHLMELYEREAINKTQFIKRLRDYITALSTKADLTKDEYNALINHEPPKAEQTEAEQIKLAKTKWLDD